MPPWLSVGAIILGAALLYFGAEALVRGATRLARMLGVPAVVVGLTVVSYGTSLPEFSVTVVSAMRNATDIALGNVIGSNIANLGLILGVAALVRPLGIERGLVRREMPLLLAVTVLMFVMVLDGEIGHLDGALLAIGGLGYTVFCVATSKRRAEGGAKSDSAASGAKDGQPAKRVNRLHQVLFILLGMVLLGLGAHSFVTGAASLARLFGISERVIGLSLVALGTSLPELAASTVASVKGEDDISLGNVVGSNIFNIVFVLGVAATVHPIAAPVTTANVIDMVIVLALTVALVLMSLGRRGVGRVKGALLLSAYLGYVVYLFAWR